MNYSFKNYLLVPSCLVIFLNVSDPGFSMDGAEEEQNNSSSIIKNTKINEEKESYFTITEFGNRKFDPQKWGLELIKSRTNIHKVDYLFEVLEEAASEGNADALQKMYLFSTKESMGIKRVNAIKAAQALRAGLLRKHAWVIPIYEDKLKSLQCVSQELIQIKKSTGKVENLTPQQEELIRLHCEVANTPLQSPKTVTQSEKFLESLYPFHVQTWVPDFLGGLQKENIDTMIVRLKSYGYYKYFSDLYEAISLVNGKNPKVLEFRSKAEQFLLAGAALDDPLALNNLSVYYEKKKQWKQAMQLYQLLAKERGDIGAMYTLANGYIKGDILEKDSQKAFECLTKAADKFKEELSIKGPANYQNLSRKMFYKVIFLLIQNYWYPKNDKKDPVKAFKYLCALEPEATRCVKEKEQDDLDCARIFALLGSCYHYGHGVEKDDKQAFNYFNKAAQLGDNHALLQLAIAYQYGEGVEKSLTESIKYWEKISSCSPTEHVHMGFCYDGIGYELQQQADNKTAAKFFKNAYECYKPLAEKKNSQALFKMGEHHYKGLSCKKNLIIAEKFFIDAANTGDLEVIYSLGYFYVEEYKRDLVAFNWFKKAADLGHALAQYDCGILLLYRHVSKDDSHEEDAVSYFNKSAKQDYAPAMMQLGKYYLERSDAESEKGKQNSESAFFWLTKAASLGNSEALTLLKETEEKKEVESEDSLVSQDLEKCLKNLEDIENGVIEPTKVVEIKIEKPPLLLSDPRKNDDETESSSDESEILANTIGTDNILNTSFSTLIQTTESSAQDLENKKGTTPFLIGSDEAVETFTPIAIHKDKNIFKNPKLLRAQLKAAGLAFKKKEENALQSKEACLAPESSLIISVLKNKKERENITYASLHKLFSDPYFTNKGHVELKQTKSGLSIVAKCFNNMNACLVEEVMTIGTHHNHNKTYKGYNPEFLKKVAKIVEIFI